MTNEEIIEMAREANLPSCLATHPKALERFAKLVAEKEREACAELIPPQYFHFRDWIRARGKSNG